MGTERIKYETVIVNHFIQRQYNLYIKDSVFEKALYYSVFGAIAVILLHILTLLVEMPRAYEITSFLLPFVYAILILELIKEAAVARTYNHFFHKHWIDLVILGIISSSFVFVAYLGLIKLPFFEGMKFLLEESKHYRAVSSMFKNE